MSHERHVDWKTEMGNEQQEVVLVRAPRIQGQQCLRTQWYGSDWKLVGPSEVKQQGLIRWLESEGGVMETDWLWREQPGARGPWLSQVLYFAGCLVGFQRKNEIIISYSWHRNCVWGVSGTKETQDKSLLVPVVLPSTSYPDPYSKPLRSRRGFPSPSFRFPYHPAILDIHSLGLLALCPLSFPLLLSPHGPVQSVAF